MTLPSPFNVVVPSAADGTALECRLYGLPPHTGEKPLTWNAAVVAHPYATLGGDFNDPVVLLIAEELHDAGYFVLTFNFRGATKYRRAATSWTSKPERQDYASVVYLLIQYMLIAKPQSAEKLKIIMAGYSYGSMIASSMPPTLQIVNEIDSSNKQASIKTAAQDLATKTAISDPIPSSELPSIDTCYLLISPLLPPLTSFLTLFSGGNGEQHLRTHKTLAVYGSEDHFTSSKKLSRWTEKLGIQAEEVEGAGHFWQDFTAVRIMRDTISEWAR